jgi:hypothetical protein
MTRWPGGVRGSNTHPMTGMRAGSIRTKFDAGTPHCDDAMPPVQGMRAAGRRWRGALVRARRRAGALRVPPAPRRRRFENLKFIP